MTKKTHKIAFVVPEFPAVSMSWLLSQVVGLVDRGIEVDIYAFKQGETKNISEDYITYNLLRKTQLLDFPKNYFIRYAKGLWVWWGLLFQRPQVALAVLNLNKYGKEALSLKLLYKVAPFIGKEKKYNVLHCHFGTVANKFIPVKEILGLKQPHIVTFYGYDISHIPQEKGKDVYANVIQHFDQFLVMSENMKKRILPLGFPVESIIVHPISIDVASYPFKERSLKADEKVQMSAVGRFVEKKGFDDLIRAIGIVKKKATQPFKVNLVGDGDLRSELEQLAKDEEVTDVIDFRGYMKLDDIKGIYDTTHIYLQPSKTAKDGDQE